MELLEQGESPATIARILGVKRTSLHRWRRMARLPDGLTAKPPSGAKRRLGDAQLAELERLLDKGAPAHGFPNELWTSARVAQVIQRHFGVKYHPDYVRRLLRRRLNWTSHKPQRRARQRNDKEVERWKADEFPASCVRRGGGTPTSPSSTSRGSCSCRWSAAPWPDGASGCSSAAVPATTGSR